MAPNLLELSNRWKRLARLVPAGKPVLARVVVEILEDRTLPSVTVAPRKPVTGAVTNS